MKGFFKPWTRLAMGAFLAASALAVASVGCGSSRSPASPVPTATSTTGATPKAGVIPATVVTATDLGGGLPESFAKAFQTANASGKWQPASAWAAAAKSLPAGQKLKAGFIFVGSEKDLGYNQAAYEGSQWLASHNPNVEILYAENIPETAQVQAVEEQMIQQGAKIIFATSYGYSDPTIEVANKHPDVAFLHMGALKSTQNFSAFFGDIWQLEYVDGIAAARMSKTGKLGFVAAFPIPQTLLNVNAFELGARSVNPKATTTFVLTGSWCDPAKQATAAKTLLDSGVDVITQHQDCTGTITQAAERANAYVTGYHQDASSAAPNGWLTGAVWNWGPVYAEIVKEIMDGTYKSNVMFAGLEAGFVKLAPFGKNVSPDLRKEVSDVVEGLRAGKIQPFTGPVADQDGKVQIQAGVVPTNNDLQSMNYLVAGVIGSAKQ